MRERIRRLTALSVLVVVVASCAQAQQPGTADVKITHVALFKNGLGYIHSEATLPDGATSVTLGQLPVPSHGTFWVAYPQEVKVRGVFTRMEDAKEARDVQSLRDMLAANLGQAVTVYGPGDPISGTIHSVVEPDTPERPSPYAMNALFDSRARRYGNALLLLKTEQGMVTINADSVTRVDFAEERTSSTVESKVRRPEMRLALEGPAGGEDVSISCLVRGLTWAPSYYIDITDEKTARLSAKAVVINEVADMENVQLELITGFPNIQFAEINSPVAMTQKLDEFMKAIERGRSENRRCRSDVFRQTVMANAAFFPEGPGVPSYSTAAAGATAEDLFFYPVGNLTLARDETACLPLFTVEAPYYHIYTWSIPDYLDEYERYRRDRKEDERALARTVWHSCRVTNTGKLPWTTAPAEFANDGRFVGQDICYFTAPGAETTIRINRAVSMPADETEFEVERQRDAARFYGNSFDLVTVKGELKLRSHLDKKARVEVTKELSGEVVETAPDAEDISTAKGLRRVNPGHRLVWDIEIEPGKETTLTYTYKVYVRN